MHPFKSLAAVIATALVIVSVDSLQPPSAQWLTQASLMAIHAYRHTLSPLLVRNGHACRFVPTCSRYAETVLERDGFAKGSWKVAARIARCGPWTQLGTVDPP